MCIYIYIYVCVYVCVYIYIYPPTELSPKSQGLECIQNFTRAELMRDPAAQLETSMREVLNRQLLATAKQYLKDLERLWGRRNWLIMGRTRLTIYGFLGLLGGPGTWVNVGEN